MSTAELKDVIRTYVHVQTGLVAALKRDLGLRDWQYLTDVPHRGQLEVDGTRWDYECHGTGVRFCSGRCVVDMNRHLDFDASAFDAGRLVEYIDSLGWREVLYLGTPIEFGFENGPKVLRAMEAAGQIKRVPGCEGDIYVMA